MSEFLNGTEQPLESEKTVFCVQRVPTDADGKLRIHVKRRVFDTCSPLRVIGERLMQFLRTIVDNGTSRNDSVASMINAKPRRKFFQP